MSIMNEQQEAGSQETSETTTEAAPPVPVPVQPTAGKVVAMPQSAIKRLKDEARERGRKDAVGQLDELAKQAGFTSAADAFGALARAAKATPAKPAEDDADESDERDARRAERDQRRAKGQQNGKGAGGRGFDQRAQARLEQERDKLREQNAKLLAQSRRDEKRRRDLQHELESKEAEMQLREAAMGAGITDVDYAVRHLQRALDGKTEDELKTFDESKFFVELLQSKPYLGGEVVRPARTGAGATAAPPPPKPGHVTQAEASSKQVDANKASATDFQQLLRERGLTLNM